MDGGGALLKFAFVVVAAVVVANTDGQIVY
jgi:hypothetical protein